MWKIKCCLLALILFLASAGTAYGGTFLDIEEEYTEQVETVTDLGFLYYSLVPYFSPEKLITRKEAAEVMYILDKGYFYNDGATSNVSNFKDVYKNDYVINYCRENGLIRGYRDNLFKPNNPVTYAEMIEMFVKTLGYEDQKVLSFPDEHLSVAADVGLLNGVSFEPGDYVTNLDAAVLTFNALTLPLFPVWGKQNLLETRFADLRKLALETNDRVERMLDMLEDLENIDIDLLNADFAMINDCYKRLSAYNVNCEFKFNDKVQYLRKLHGYANTISSLEKEAAALDGITVYMDFSRYTSLINEYHENLLLLESSPNYDKRRSDIMLAAIYRMLDKYEELLLRIEPMLPGMENFAEAFGTLESGVLESLDLNVINNQTPIDFYNEDNWVNELINHYNETEGLFNFISELGLMENYEYYDKMYEITYIITSIYYIKGCEYSMTTSNEFERALAPEMIGAGRELYDEIKQTEFIYYKKQIDSILAGFDSLFELYGQQDQTELAAE